MPLFPTYLFVEASTAARWRSVNGTIGAKCIITSNDSPVAVEPGFIEALQASGEMKAMLKKWNLPETATDVSHDVK